MIAPESITVNVWWLECTTIVIRVTSTLPKEVLQWISLLGKSEIIPWENRIEVTLALDRPICRLVIYSFLPWFLIWAGAMGTTPPPPPSPHLPPDSAHSMHTGTPCLRPSCEWNTDPSFLWNFDDQRFQYRRQNNLLVWFFTESWQRPAIIRHILPYQTCSQISVEIWQHIQRAYNNSKPPLISLIIRLTREL